MVKEGFSFVICLVLLLPVTSVAESKQRQRGQRSEECNVSQLEALEPSRRLKSEAGLSEFWDHNNEQFQCAGVSVARHTIEPKGLFLPSSSNSPRLIYVLEGEGTGGLVVPGCQESYQSIHESSQRQLHERRFGEERSRRTSEGESGWQQQDQHQKVHRLSEGYVLAVPAGIPVWSYNNGDSPLIIVVLLDTGNYINQLDNIPRRFFLGGSNPQQSGQHRGETTHYHVSESHRRGGSSYGDDQLLGNVLNGFDVELLAKAFGINEETARKLQGREEEKRGFIVRADEGIHILKPREISEYEEERRRGGSSERGRKGSSSEWEQKRGESERGHSRGHGNGIEEALCNVRFAENIGNPIYSDVYSKEAGHLTSLNSQKLPILKHLQLSAEKGHLHGNAIMGPQWNVNSHSIVYTVRGSARIQIVDSRGNLVLDERVRQDQIFVIPQNFVVLARAEENGFQWISFKTNDNAISNNLAGKGSSLRGIPVDVLANSYQISREEALMLKDGRSQELAVFVPQQSPSERDSLVAAA